MDDQKHADVQDGFGLLQHNALGKAAAERLEEHLRDCQQCREEWESLRKFSASLSAMEIAAALPDLNPPHPDEADLWNLADGGADSLTDADHQLWTHVLNCGLCFRRLLLARQELWGDDPLLDIPDSSPTAAAIWDLLQARRIHVLLSWAGVYLQIAVRTSRTGARAKRRGPAQEGTAIREPNQAWTLERQFGAYTMALRLVPLERKTVRVDVSIAGPEANSVRFEFSNSRGEQIATGLGELPELPPLDLEAFPYSLRLTDENSGELLGLLDLAVGPPIG